MFCEQKNFSVGCEIFEKVKETKMLSSTEIKIKVFSRLLDASPVDLNW